MALKDVPAHFSTDSEEDLRTLVVTYFQELGFDHLEMSLEDQFNIQLGHTKLAIAWRDGKAKDSVHGRSDILLKCGGQNLAIIETKAPNHALTIDDALQGISYARLLREIAPFVIVTNGTDTRIYDTLTSDLTCVDSILNSRWYQAGKVLPQVSQDIIDLAAKTLVGLNANTLEAFCFEQTATALHEVSGTPNQRKSYIPDLYTPRHDVETSFEQWLADLSPCFAVIGESGFGKTNFMCHTAEHFSATHLMLFYTASHLGDNGIFARLVNDFMWEFRREKTASYIIERFDAIVRQHNKIFVLFLDGIDEYAGNKEVLKRDLLDLVKYIDGTSIKLCISCKTFDWGTYVLDKTMAFNSLARAIYPRNFNVLNPPTNHMHNSDEVGVSLKAFTAHELAEAFPKYQSAFHLSSILRGQALTQCLTPWLLRLTSDIFADKSAAIPEDIETAELFKQVLALKLQGNSVAIPAKKILTSMARVSIETAKNFMTKQELLWEHSSDQPIIDAYDTLLRTQLLVESRDDNGIETIRFGLPQLVNYVYTILAEEWPILPVPDVAAKMLSLLSKHVGYEAMIFYLRYIDKAATPLLQHIARRDLRRFSLLVQDLKNIIQPLKDTNTQEIALLLDLYIGTYSILVTDHFPDLQERVQPFHRGEIGLFQTAHNSYLYRTINEDFPQRVLTQEQYLQTHPNIMIPLSVGNVERFGHAAFNTPYPQFAAWHDVQTHVAELFVDRLLNEGATPFLLQERIWEILLYQPNSARMGCKAYQVYYKEMGFITMEEVTKVNIVEVIARAMKLVAGIVSESIAHPDCVSWYNAQLKYVFHLLYALRQLQDIRSCLDVPLFSLDDLFSYLKEDNLPLAAALIELLLPAILDSYQTMMDNNFSVLAPQSDLYRYRDHSIIVQVVPYPFVNNKNSSIRKTSFLTLCYIILSSVHLPQKYYAYACEEDDCVAGLDVAHATLNGQQISRKWLGKMPITVIVEGQRIEDPEALLYFTRFPSHHPILDQVYQLIGQEVQFLMNGDFHRWHNLDSGNIQSEALNIWIANEIHEGKLRLDM